MRVRFLTAVLVLAAAACDDREPITAQTVVLSLSPDALSFGEVPIGASSVRTLVALNLGNAPWVPAAPPEVVGEGFSWRSGCDVAVGPGEACTLAVALTPATTGPHSGSVRIATTNGTPVVSESVLNGTATPATIVFTPEAVDFGDVIAGEVRTANVLVENTGEARIETRATIIGDAAAAFFVGSAGSTSVPLVLAGGDRASLRVAFRPRQAGAAAAQLVAEVCGSGCGPGLALSGDVSAPRIEASVRQIDFGAVDIGAVATSNVRISNVGTGALEVSTASLASSIGPELVSEASVALPVILAAGEGFDVTITFAPVQGRAALATQLNIASSDARSPFVFVPIAGNVDGPGIQVVPGAVHFGRLADGGTRDSTMVVRSVGSAAVTLERLRLTNDAFSIVSAPTLPQTMLPGAALQFVVRATATPGAIAAGGVDAELAVESAGVDDVVANLAFLAGSSGCAPVAIVPHAQLGTVQIGAGTTGSVVVENIGDAPCELEALVPGGSGFAFDSQFVAVPVDLEEIAPGAVGEVAFGFAGVREGSPSAIVELRFVDVPAPLFVSANANVVRSSITVAPALLAFGPRGQTCGNETKTAALINDGGSPVTVTSIAISSSLFSVTTRAPLPAPVVPGGSLPLDVTAYCALAAVGTHSAVATITTSTGLSVDLNLTLETVPAGIPTEEHFTAGEAVNAVDILFVVDNSGSMADDQQQLADNFEAFFADALADGQHDFNVGVTTTDVLLIDAAAGSLVGSVPILTPSTPRLEAEFANNVLVGIEGAGVELGLEATRLALDPSLNVGFVRREAALSVVFVADEDDNGGDPLSAPPELLRSPDEYVAILRSLKGGNLSNTPILVSGAITPGSPRYEAVIDAFNGSTIDIAAPDWGPQLARFGVDTFSLSRTFVLAGTTDQSSISVSIDGQQTSAWTWDPSRNAVVLDDNAPSGSDVAIVYQGDC
jgi:hypothetical protein